MLWAGAIAAVAAADMEGFHPPFCLASDINLGEKIQSALDLYGAEAEDWLRLFGLISTLTFTATPARCRLS